MKILFPIVFLFLFCGCNGRLNRNINHSYDEFPIVQELLSKPITTIPFGNINGMVVIDTFLVLQNMGESSFFKVYSSLSYEKLFEFAQQGRGLGEFMLPNLVQSSLNNNNHDVWIYDAPRGLFKVDLVGSVLSEKFIYKHIDDIFMQDHDALQISFIENEIIGFRTLNARFGLLKKYDSLPDLVPFSATDIGVPVEDRFKSGVYASFIGANLKQRKVFSAFRLLPRIEFFDLNGNYINTTVYDNEKPNIEKIKELYTVRDPDKIRDVRMYIEATSYDDRYIYMLFNDITEEILFGDDPSLFPNSHILVFNWEGEPVKRIVLDKFIFNFTIDTKHEKILAYCPTEFDYPIYSYCLNDLSEIK